MTHIKLISLLREILNEVGDLNNADLYSYKKVSDNKINIIYEFLDSDNHTVTVKFHNLDEYKDELPSALEGSSKYNISYQVEGESIKYKTTSLNVLNGIFKTIKEIITEFIKEYNPDFLFIKGTSDTDLLEPNFTKKDKIYFNIVTQNIGSEYGISIGPILGLTGIQLRKK